MQFLALVMEDVRTRNCQTVETRIVSDGVAFAAIQRACAGTLHDLSLDDVGAGRLLAHKVARCRRQQEPYGGGCRRILHPYHGCARVWVRSLSLPPTRRPSFRGVVLRTALSVVQE